MKLNKKLVYIISAIVLIAVVVIVIVLNSQKLDADSKEVQELYSFLGSNDLQVCEGLLNYSDREINYDTLSTEAKICLAYSLVDENNINTLKIDKTKKNNTCSINDKIKFATDNYEDKICTVSKIDKETLNNQYKKMYGKDIEDYKEFSFDASTTCIYDDGNYYCGLKENYTYTIGAEPTTYRSIKKVDNKKDEIIIYDYFLKIVNNECYSSYVNEKKDDKCTDKYEVNKDMKYSFLKKYGTLYKHTFKKQDNNYYWVSSEPQK